MANKRLESIFQQFGQKAKTQTCDAMEGLIKEGKDMINLGGDDNTRDAGLIAAAALLLDYVLVVAVGISAGIGALVSAIPVLQPYTLPLCLAILTLILVGYASVAASRVMLR